ncbi:hypothetical protein [Clostridium phage CP3]|nr:hypothetical protein [Clostridium phage CP3]
MDNHSLEVIELQSEYRELERRWHQFLDGHAHCEEEAIQVKEENGEDQENFTKLELIKDFSRTQKIIKRRVNPSLIFRKPIAVSLELIQYVFSLLV